jgi:PAS domain S-box-containing protein
MGEGTDVGERQLKILIAEDEAAHAEAISGALEAAGRPVEIRVAGTLSEYRQLAAQLGPDIALIDLNLPDGRATEVLTHPPENGEFPIMIMTAYGNERMAVEALRAGALDYVVKSSDAFAAMPRAVERTLREWRLLREHKNADESRLASLRFLETVHRHAEIEPLLEELTSEIKHYTGCDSIAIRVLDKEGNIPYHAYKGFSRKFVEMESPLSVKMDRCMCINVIKGTTDPRLPFYTQGGSFYMNGTTRFLATVSEEEKGETRNVCNAEGYESVALVPFRSGGRVLGLIHVADHRENMVPLRMVELLESVALQLGTAFQRANAEAALRESEERYRTLFENSVDSVLLTIPDGRILSANPAACRMFDRTEEEICGLGREGLVDENDPRLARLLEERSRNGRASGELTFIRKDGSQFPGEVSSLTFKDASGSLRSSMIVRDITERKRAEEALRASERQYRQLVDNALVGVYRSTSEGKFLYVNDALARLFECKDAHEMLSLPVELRYKNREDREAFLTILKERGRVPYYETEVPTKSGKIKSIVISAVLEDGFITGMVIDVTERKNLEAQLRHSQKMEAVGTLAGGIAHDFNNILNVILGFGSMVMDRIRGDQLAQERMKEVLAAAERAENLTKRLLLFSRKGIPEFKPVDVNETVINVEKMLSRIIGEDINIVTDLMGPKALVMADAGQMEQVLMNLATNARDAMPKGGTLTISTELRAIDDEFIGARGYGVPGRYAVISVSDTGTGIDELTQGRIFDPFFTTKEVGKGTGLGLSIAYGIIEQHSGYIKTYSEPGKGTTFKIWLPVTEGSAEKKPVGAALPPLKGGTETILVAEDDASMRKMTRIVLERYGYRVITAEDGEDAIAKFTENRDRIHLVMLDMVMPKKSGKEVYAEIRRMIPGIRALFLSGYTADTIDSHELRGDGLDSLHKPVLPKDLLRKVREILDS